VSEPTVVIGVDGSPGSEVAARAAVALLGEEATYVVVRAVTVPPPTSPTGRFGATALEPLREEERVQAQDELADFAASLPVEVEAIVAPGDPATLLLDVADRTDADVIVVGSRGLGAVKRAILGSVSTRVVGEARRPVLVVPA